MAFSTRRFVKHIDKYDTIHRLEIQEDGFSGTESAISTTGSVFRFEHETHTGSDEELLNVYENPVQKGSIELHLLIQDSTDRTLIDDIFNGDEDDFRLVWKIDGSIYWTGTILNDMLEYPESDFPYPAKLWAKDFSRLKGIDYSLSDSRQTLITTFANLLSNLGYGLDIETHTSWTTSDTTDSIDFLQQVYHETKALREFARTGNETDQPIGVIEALEILCRNFGCVVRQEGGVFKIIQYSEYETPSSVNVTVYDSSGTEKTPANSTDLTLDASTNDITITDRSITKAFKAIKRARVKFEHRTEVSRINEISFDLDDSTVTSDSESQTIISDGDQTLDFSFFVLADTSVDAPSSTFSYVLKAGTYYWDQANYVWTENGGVELTNDVDLTKTTDKPGLELWIGNNSYLTDNLPSDADGLLTVKAYIPTNMENATVNTRIFINNAQAEKDSKYINYELTQSGGFSTLFDLGSTWFGDGPVVYSPSALRYSSADANITQDSWQRRGTTTGYRNFHENLLKEIVDLQRSNKIRTDGQSVGADYDAEKILTYRSKNLAYTGGSFIGEEGDWHPVLFEIDVITGTDTFDDILKFADEGSTGTSSTEDSTSTGGGIDQSTADARYFRQSQAFDELATADIDTALANLGLKDGSRDLDLNSLSFENSVGDRISLIGSRIGATNMYGSGVESGALYWKSSAAYRWYSGNNADGGTSAIASLDSSGNFAGNTLRSDTGKFLSPTSYQFRNAGDTGFRDVQMAGLTATTGLFSGLTTHQGGIKIEGGSFDFVANTVSLSFERTGTNAGGWDAVISQRNTDENGSFFWTAKNATSDWLFRDSNNNVLFHLDTSEAILNLAGDVQNPDFSSGWLADGGKGFSVYQDASATTQWNAEFNNLLIRGRLKVFELIVKQIATLGGTEILSVAVAEADSVSGSAGSEVVSITDPRGFGGTSLAADDLVIVQRVDINDTTVVKQELRTVSSITGTDVTFTSTSGAPDPSDAIEAGDIIVAYGNTTNSARQNIMYRSVEGELVSRFQSGVDSYADFNSPGATSNLIMGDLTDAQTLSNGTTPNGFGFYAKGSAYLEGEIVASSGQIANWDIEPGYITDGSVYLGNDLLGIGGAAGNVLVGNLADGAAPGLQVYGDTTNTRVQLIGRTSSASSIFSILRDGNEVVGISGDSAKFFGAFVDNTGLWAGGGATSSAATKSDSNIWMKFDTGEFYYKAMGTTIHNAFAGGSGATIDDSYWTNSHSYSSTVTSTDTQSTNMFKVRFTKQFGENIVNVFAPINVDMTRSDTDATFSFDVVLDVSSVSSTDSVSNTTTVFSTVDPGAVVGYTSYSIDISSLDDDELYELTITFDTTVHINDTDGSISSGTIDTDLRKDVYLRTGTG